VKYLSNKNTKSKTGIYKITNTVNNKFYIGSTSCNFANRYYQHISDYKKGKRTCTALYRAFAKYGLENFSFEIIEVCSKEDCISREQYYLDKGSDYNCAKLAHSVLGLKHHPSSKTKTLIGALHHDAKEVFQFDLKGNFIQRFGSIIDALKHLNSGKNNSNHISKVCSGESFSALGYRWSFKKNGLKTRPKRKIQTVTIIELENQSLKFNTQKEACKFFNDMGYPTRQGAIAGAIRRNYKLYGYTIKQEK